MNPENTKMLFDKFSFLKPKPSDNIRNNLMFFGFECGNGWTALLYRLCKNIEKVLIEEKLEGFQVLQVKEKYAQLDVNVNLWIDKIEVLLDEAHDDSAHICEECGCPGHIDNYKGWYYCRCINCWEKLKDNIIQ